MYLISQLLTRSILKQNKVFLLLDLFPNEAKVLRLPIYLPITFSKALVQTETQRALYRSWTWITDFISSNGDNYVKRVCYVA